MILDRLDAFMTTAGSETLGYADGGNYALTPTSEVRDFGAAGAMDTSGKKYINFEGVAALAGGQGMTLAVTLESHEDADFGSSQTDLTLWSGANIAATSRAKFLLPEGMKRYARIKCDEGHTSTDVSTSGGRFKVFLSVS